MRKMNEAPEVMVSLEDFSVICRICLQSHDDMVDIFGSGIHNQLMEITKLKVKYDDKLPKTLCQNCRTEIEYILKFQEKAKSSDILLKSLLTDKADRMKSLIFKTKRRRTKCSKKKLLSNYPKQRKKLKPEMENNKMYLIVVPQVDNNGVSEVKEEICIKDLSFDEENEELTNYCQNLVNDYFIDHSYSEKSSNASECLGFKPNQTSSELNNSDLNQTNQLYRVNLFIFKCQKCEQFFDEQHELLSHYLLFHNIKEPIPEQCSYNCPVCNWYEIYKPNFLNHLEKHKEEGCQFIKVNPNNKEQLANNSQEHIFLNSPSSEDFNENHKVLKLSLDIFSCTKCLKKIQSQNNIFEHWKLNHNAEVSSEQIYVRYNCPLCNGVSFLGEKAKFFEHLHIHKKNNFYFIKVNSLGEPLKLEQDEEIFVSYEDAFEISKIMDKSKKFFPVVDLYSCDRCDYSGHSLQALNEHSLKEHSVIQIVLQDSLFCPVCDSEIGSHTNDDIRNQLYQHLKVHKTEGFLFIEVNRNGSIKTDINGYDDIFNQSPILHGITNGSLTVDWNRIWYPEFGADTSNRTADCLTNEPVVDDRINYVCEKCGKTLLGKINYKKHFLNHLKISGSVSRRPVCTICNKTFANRTSLSNHIRNHVQEGDGNDELESSLPGIICDVCGKTFSNRTSLTIHKRVHKAAKENASLKCEICNREFFRKTSYDRHKSAHLNPKYFDCDVCKLPLPSATSLKKHAEIHRKTSDTFDCRACETSFLTKESLTAHQTHTGHYLDRKPLECNVCHQKFFIGKKFTEHIKTHPKYKMGECTLCGKRLSTVQSLMLHIGRHFESNSILCPHCGKQFFEERNFHRHLLTHEGIKPFGCDVEGCQKSFYTLFELNRHKKYHSNTRDFVCPYCGKSFHEANHLTVHVRTHTGERPYICPHCNKGFITRTRCKHHIKLVHQGVGYDLIQSTISKKVTVFEAIEAVV